MISSKSALKWWVKGAFGTRFLSDSMSKAAIILNWGMVIPHFTRFHTSPDHCVEILPPESQHNGWHCSFSARQLYTTTMPRCTPQKKGGRRHLGVSQFYIIRAPATRTFPCRRPSVGNRRLYTLAAPAADPFVGPRGYPVSTPCRPRVDLRPNPRDRFICYLVGFCARCGKHRFLQCFVAFSGHDFRLTGRRWCRLRAPRGQA